MLICSGCGGVKSGGCTPLGVGLSENRVAVGVCRVVPALPPEIGRRGGVVEIVLLPVFEGVSMFVVCTRVCTIENDDSL